MKRQIAKFIGGAVSGVAIPLGYGFFVWWAVLGAAAIGGVCGLYGVNVARYAKTLAARRKK